MNKTEVALRPLRRSLPEIPGPAVIDEDGEKWHPGFSGDISHSPLYVTDGHILLLSAMIDPTIAIERNEDSYARKYATEIKIGEVWKPAEDRDDVIADFIGVCGYGGSAGEIAFVRDTRGRVMIVNAYLLAFGIRAIRPDAMTVRAAPIGATCCGPSPDSRWFDSPLALRRVGKLGCLLMPMRLAADEFKEYDLRGEPVDLAGLISL